MAQTLRGVYFPSTEASKAIQSYTDLKLDCLEFLWEMIDWFGNHIVYEKQDRGTKTA